MRHEHESEIREPHQKNFERRNWNTTRRRSLAATICNLFKRKTERKCDMINEMAYTDDEISYGKREVAEKAKKKSRNQ